MRVLITNNSLALRGGSELYVRDLAIALVERGHQPVAFSTHLGEISEELRRATVPVIDDLANLAEVPDVIHGQHHLDTMMALLHFPGVPAVFFCHGWSPWEEIPLRSPRIRRYVAVDDTCRERLVAEWGVPSHQVDVILNFVDLARFRPRGPLPAQPARALVFANDASESTQLPAIRAACERRGIALDAIGLNSGRPVARPEEELGAYDLVFATARSALEAMAVGAATVACDSRGLAGMVTSGDFDRVRGLNFGIRSLRRRLDVDTLVAEIDRYDAEDARRVSARVRAEAGREEAVDRIVALYEDVRAAAPAPTLQDAEADSRAAGRYFRWLGAEVKPVRVWEERQRLEARVREIEERTEAASLEAAANAARLAADVDRLRTEVERIAAERDRLSADRDQMAAERDQMAAERDQMAAERDQMAAERNQMATDVKAQVARGDRVEADRLALRAELDRERAEHASGAAEVAATKSLLRARQEELALTRGTLTWRLRERLLGWDRVRRIYRSMRGLA